MGKYSQSSQRDFIRLLFVYLFSPIHRMWNAKTQLYKCVTGNRIQKVFFLFNSNSMGIN